MYILSRSAISAGSPHGALCLCGFISRFFSPRDNSYASVVAFSARNESLPEATLLVVQLLALDAFSFENSPFKLNRPPSLTFSVDGKILNPDKVYALECAWYQASLSLSSTWHTSGYTLVTVESYCSWTESEQSDLLMLALVLLMGSHVILEEVGPYSFTTGKPLKTLYPWYVSDGSFYVYAKPASAGSRKRLSFTGGLQSRNPVCHSVLFQWNRVNFRGRLWPRSHEV